MERITIGSLAAKITSEADAYAFMESLRWPDKPVCPHCGSIADHYYLTPKAPEGRKTRTGSISQRRVWKCRDCRKQFSVLTGTIFHGSKVHLQTWLFVVFEMAANKNGLAAREIERKYGVSPKTAWFMAHRIREAMKTRAPLALLTGTIVADETWVGGNPGNDHYYKAPRPVRPGENMGTQKTPVLSLINAETGEVRSKVVAHVTGATLRKVISENVAMADSRLMTDEGSWYIQLGKEFTSHETVNHSRDEYVRGDVSTNLAEGYFSQLKRSLDGTFHHVSVEHLDRYLAEFDFRYSSRKISDTQRTARLMGQTAGRRLTYKRLAGS
jgi:transposase-like protein